MVGNRGWDSVGHHFVNYSGGGGLVSRGANTTSIVGYVCVVASTGKDAYGASYDIGKEDLVGGSTYEIGPFPPFSTFPTLDCHMNAAYLYGEDGSSLIYKTAEELAAAGLTYEFTIPGADSQPPTGSAKYVALGDSYSSGEGNSPYIAEAGDCHRSLDSAWPTLLAEALPSQLELTANIACSGATTEALTGTFKGQPPQLEALQKLSPKIVTVTIGGNDIGFASTLQDCRFNDCVRSGKLAYTASAIESARGYLPLYYEKIAKAAGTGSRVIVVGRISKPR
jgi:lysophospholipase L1-like esterase